MTPVEPNGAPERPESHAIPRGKVVPLFPLPDVWLFPAVILPLHVFEPRYRRMLEDSLDGPGRLVLGTIQAGHESEAAGAPPIYPLAGLGEIGRHERRADGCFDILLVGLKRVFVSEVQSAHPYRMVETFPAIETPIAPAREAELRARLLGALEARLGEGQKVPPEFTSAHLADMLALRLPLEHARRNALYLELDTEKRALAALAEHERCARAG